MAALAAWVELFARCLELPQTFQTGSFVCHEDGFEPRAYMVQNCRRAIGPPRYPLFQVMTERSVRQVLRIMTAHSGWIA